jgi:hypothetical protein
MRENAPLSLNLYLYILVIEFVVFVLCYIVIDSAFILSLYGITAVMEMSRFKNVWTVHYKCKVLVYDQAAELSGNLT